MDEKLSLEEATILELQKNYSKEYLKESPVRVGVTGEYLIVVNTNDGGHIPHFHIIDENTRGKEFDCCVMIEKSQYFPHGKHKSKLTNVRDRKDLDKFLRKQFPKSKFNGTNWDYIVFIWNDNNSFQNVDEDLKQPDYTNIEDYK